MSIHEDGPLTGKLDAGYPPVRFGGRGGRVQPAFPTPIAPNYTPVATTETRGGLIVDAGVVVGNKEEAALVPAVDRIQEHFNEKPKQVLEDRGFHNGADLAALEQRQVETLIPARQEFKENSALRPDPTVAVAESPFGIIKQTMHFRRFLLRGIAKVRTEWRWVATGFPDSHRDPN